MDFGEPMTDGKYRVIVKLNLPPEDSYHSGHSLIVQGNTVQEVADLLTDVKNGGDTPGNQVLQRFSDFGFAGIERQTLREETASRYD